MVVIMVSQYIIYGERHSGTKFLEKLICSNFDIKHANGFQHKHFFTPDNILNQSQNTIEKTVFFCIVRNPYDWILAFHKVRHHCGIIGANNIYAFMSKNWLSRELFLGPEIMTDRHLYNKLRYKNIFHMRSAKNTFMYSILPTYVKHHVFVRYEDFLEPIYVDHFVNYISNIFSIKKIHSNNKTTFNNKRNYYAQIDSTLLNYINNSIDWGIENLIGYQKALEVKEL